MNELHANPPQLYDSDDESAARSQLEGSMHEWDDVDSVAWDQAMDEAEEAEKMAEEKKYGVSVFY